MQPPSLLRCEYLTDPLGIGLTPPRLSWEPPCDQSAYQVSISIRGECAHPQSGGLFRHATFSNQPEIQL